MPARPVQPVVFMDNINRNEPEAERAASFSDWAASRKPVEPAPEKDPERFAFRNRAATPEAEAPESPEHPAMFDPGDVPDV